MGFLQVTTKSRNPSQKANRNTARPNQNLHYRKLRLEFLENRRLLATFFETGSTLKLALATHEQLSIVSHATSYSLSLGDTGTWAGLDSALATSKNGSPVLTITAAGIAALSNIAIADIGAGASVRFEDSGEQNIFKNFSVNLDKGEAESVTICGAVDFGKSEVKLSAPQITIEGSLIAEEIQLSGIESLTVTGIVQAPTLTMTTRLLDNSGELSSSAATGGLLSINAERLVNTGRITADGSSGMGGSISIELTQRMIQTQSGMVSASGMRGNGGQVIISVAEAAGSDLSSLTGVYLSGQMVADGSGTKSVGGDISVLGQQLDLYGLRMQANGEGGGGKIRLGDALHGVVNTKSAQNITVNRSTVISADALTCGDGGEIRIWSDQQTSCAGILTARGGVQQGDGGKIGVSAQASLNWQGETDLSASAGQSGSLWLDPKNIIVGGPAFSEFVDPNPAAGNQFGLKVVPLSTGNVVITSPYDDFSGTDAGAVYLFNGATGALISTLRGSIANGLINMRVIVLTNGNYVVSSPYWGDGTLTYAGAVTWGSGTTGVSGVISSANSLVGSHSNDEVGNAQDPNENTITALSNGNYIVRSPCWCNGSLITAGAVTWGNGTTGISGLVSSTNSLVGSTAGDQVSSGGVTVLTNGNYVISSPSWANGAIAFAGAVTWASGTTAITGVISSVNSLVGSHTNDQVGYTSASNGITALINGNYVVSSPSWHNGTVNDAGAVTWGSGTTGVSGVISSTNSLIGSHVSDRVGYRMSGSAVIPLINGNYVVSSYSWFGAGPMCGAVTWGSGTTGVSGVISSENSLIGNIGDFVGGAGVTALTNGNYVICSPLWQNGNKVTVGAVTWGNGATGIRGMVSSANSLVGSTLDDQVGNGGVTALTNGNYVVCSYYWNSGTAARVGAVTWENGTSGTSGMVSSLNSLVGSTAYDQVGLDGVTRLNNGNFSVSSRFWDNGAITDVGAVTWGSGTMGISGVVSSANSLIGSHANDKVGYTSSGSAVTPLNNGNYVVSSPSWDNGTVSDAGAVTWGSGTMGVSGVVSSANSLVGSHANDKVGYTSSGNAVTPLNNGNYVVSSPSWDNGTVTDAGAVTWGSGTLGGSGLISINNSFVGSHNGDVVGYASSGSAVTALINGNYVVNIPTWDNGTISNAGAVAWGNGAAGICGVVSSSNSLAGSHTNDQVGYGSVTPLANGNYLANSPSWDNGTKSDTGAVTWGSGTKGITGVISSANSLIGLTSSTYLQPSVVDNVNDTFYAPFYKEAGTTPSGGTYGGRVRVGSLSMTSLTSQPFDSQIGQSLTFTSRVSGTLNTGAAVTLQANNDITIARAITADNPDGNGGNLTLQSGRSLLINANIISDSGNLNLIANDSLAHGVVNADRDSGNAVITMAEGTSLDAGNGSLTINLYNSTDKTYNDRGSVTLQHISATSIVLSNGTFYANGNIKCTSLLLDHATLILNLDHAFPDSTDITVDAGELNFNGYSETIGNLIVKNGVNNSVTVESGTLTVGSIVCDTLTIGSPTVDFTAIASDWTSVGLTLKLTDDGMLHLYRTGTTTDAVTPQQAAKVSQIYITGSNLSDVLTVESMGNSVSSFVVKDATVSIDKDGDISAGTKVTIDGGKLYYNGHTDAFGNLTVINSGQATVTVIDNQITTVISGTLTATTIVCDSLVIGSDFETAKTSSHSVYERTDYPDFLPKSPNTSTTSTVSCNSKAIAKLDDTNSNASLIAVLPEQEQTIIIESIVATTRSVTNKYAPVASTASPLEPNAVVAFSSMTIMRVAKSVLSVDQTTSLWRGNSHFSDLLMQIQNNWLPASADYHTKDFEDFLCRRISEIPFEDATVTMPATKPVEPTHAVGVNNQPPIFMSRGQNIHLKALESAILDYQGSCRKTLFCPAIPWQVEPPQNQPTFHRTEKA